MNVKLTDLTPEQPKKIEPKNIQQIYWIAVNKASGKGNVGFYGGNTSAPKLYKSEGAARAAVSGHRGCSYDLVAVKIITVEELSISKDFQQ